MAGERSFCLPGVLRPSAGRDDVLGHVALEKQADSTAEQHTKVDQVSREQDSALSCACVT